MQTEHTPKTSGLSAILKGSAWITVYRMFRMVLAFVVSVVLARYLGPEAYGMLSYSVAFSLMLINFAGPGMKDVITRRMSQNLEDRDAILGNAFRILLGLNMVMLVIAVGIVMLLRQGDTMIQLLVAVIALGNVFRAFESFELWFHFRLQMRKTVLVQAFSFTAMSISKLVMVWFGATLFWFSVVIALEIVITGFGFMWLYLKDGGSIRKRKPLDFGILKESLPAIAALGFALIYLKVDQVMLGVMIGDDHVGRYAIAAQFSEYWIYVAIALITATYPAILDAAKKTVQDESFVWQRLLSMLGFGALALMIPLWFVGPFAITLLLGDAFSASGDIFRIHIWSLYFMCLTEAARKWFVIKDALVIYLITAGCAAALNIGLNFWLIPVYGAEGAAWATVATYAFAGFGSLIFFKKTRPFTLHVIKSWAFPFKMLFSR